MNNKLITLVLTLAVAIILAGSVLMPALGDAQKTAGPVKSVDNDESTHNSYLFGAVTDETITLEIDNGSFLVNGETVTISHYGTIAPIAYCDQGYIGIRNNGAALYWMEYGDTLAITTIASGTEVTLTKNKVAWGDSEYTISNVFSVGADSEQKYITAAIGSTAGPIYLTSIDQIRGGGQYTSGELTTAISFVGSNATCTATDVTVEYELEAVEGYTDLYELKSYNLLFNEGEVNAALALIPLNVEAHEAAGAAYSLYGAIGVIVIVMLLVAAISFVRRD